MKVAIIVSNDFGELSNALYLMYKQAFAQNSAIFLPKRLQEKAGNCFGLPLVPYDSVTTVLNEVEQLDPDIVLLFSGYLFPNNKIFSLDETIHLISQLKESQRVVVTSDPFLGALSDPDANGMFFDLDKKFVVLEEAMNDCAHFYPTLREPMGDYFKQPCLMAFNPDLMQSSLDGNPFDRLSLISGKRHDDLAYWLFILSSEDWLRQTKDGGTERFISNLQQRLDEVVANGRQPVLLMPSVCIECLQEKTTLDERVLILNFCDYESFLPLIVQAESVFYWNLFSNSILYRISIGRPVFFFDTGHLFIIRDRGLKYYYGGVEPVLLDINSTLSINMVEITKQVCAPIYSSWMQNLQNLPTPTEMLQQALEFKKSC